MEFYELNRFYDKKLSSYDISYKFDGLLYYLYPVVITFGIIISLVQIISLLKQGIYITSKVYSLAQSVTVFLFQLINIIIFMTNSYELNIFDNKLMNKISSYLNFKIYVNYIIILFLILNIFDFCMIVVIQPKYDDFNFNGNEDEENEEDGRASSISHSCTINDNTAYNNYIENVDSTGCVLQQQNSKEEMTPSKKSPSKNLNIQDKLRSTIRRMSTFVKAAKQITNTGCKIDPTDYKKVILINKKENLFSKPSSIRKIIIVSYILSFIFTLPQLFLYDSNKTDITLNKKVFKNYYKTIQTNDKTDSIISLNSIGSFVLINLANRSILAKHSDFNFKISTIRYEYCDILNRGYNEFQESYDMDKSGINSIIDKNNNNNFKTKNSYYNLSIICIKTSEELAKSLTINTLYFWLKHTFCLFIPSLIMSIFLFLIIYVIKNKEEFFQNYYYFLNRNNSLENIVTLKTLINRYQLPQEEINLLNREFNFLLIERYNMTIMYLIHVVLYFILILPYILLRLVLDLYIKEKIKFNLDFYILYKISFLLFHLNFIIYFFLFVFFSFKFRYSLFKTFTCNKEFLCCCCCCCNKLAKNGDKNRLLNKLAKYFTSQFSPINKNYSLKSVTDFNVERHKYFMPSNPNITDDSLLIDSSNINLHATKVLINGEVVINNNDDVHQK